MAVAVSFLVVVPSRNTRLNIDLRRYEMQRETTITNHVSIAKIPCFVDRSFKLPDSNHRYYIEIRFRLD